MKDHAELLQLEKSCYWKSFAALGDPLWMMSGCHRRVFQWVRVAGAFNRQRFKGSKSQILPEVPGG